MARDGNGTWLEMGMEHGKRWEWNMARDGNGTWLDMGMEHG